MFLVLSWRTREGDEPREARSRRRDETARVVFLVLSWNACEKMGKSTLRLRVMGHHVNNPLERARTFR